MTRNMTSFTTWSAISSSLPSSNCWISWKRSSCFGTLKKRSHWCWLRSLVTLRAHAVSSDSVSATCEGESVLSVILPTQLWGIHIYIHVTKRSDTLHTYTHYMHTHTYMYTHLSISFIQVSLALKDARLHRLHVLRVAQVFQLDVELQQLIGHLQPVCVCV